MWYMESKFKFELQCILIKKKKNTIFRSQYSQHMENKFKIWMVKDTDTEHKSKMKKSNKKRESKQ